MAGKKYYWLKLDRNFFKRHDIRIVETMPNGKEYVLFYMKLLVESIDHEGQLRFSEMIPYNDSMLATITNTNVDIVKSAIQVFSQLGLMELWDDKTIYLSDTQKMLGAETEWAKKKRAWRKKQEENNLIESKDIKGTSKDIVRQELEKEKEIELELDIEKEKEVKKSSRFTPPTLNELTSYIVDNKYNVNADTFFNHYEAVGWKVGKNKMKDWKAAVRGWHSRNDKKPTTEIEVPDYMQEKKGSFGDYEEVD